MTPCTHDIDFRNAFTRALAGSIRFYRCGHRPAIDPTPSTGLAAAIDQQ
jgi:hypothetical protein